jgi:RNA polymerase sigma-70 factor, ECF subfamily
LSEGAVAPTISAVDAHAGLTEVFRAASTEGPEGAPSAEALEAVLGAYVDAARTVWPAFGIGDEELVRYVAVRTPPGQLPNVAHAGDVLLACACARRVSAAIEAFHQRHGAVIARVLSRRRASAHVADDATQALYERLLVAPAGQTPKIGEYKGTGPLRTWVAAAAATTLLMMYRARDRRRERAPDAEVAALAAEADPELRYVKERYRAEMEEAVARAVERLSDRDRTLLRLHLNEHMSIDQLGAMYRVNRATAARWLSAARQAIVAGARDDLRARLRLTTSEWDSIVVLVRSELNVSIARRLE